MSNIENYNYLMLRLKTLLKLSDKQIRKINKLKNKLKPWESIIVSEIPYQVNKAQLLEIIGELIKDITIEGISDIRDESDRKGMRIVIEIKKDSQADIVLNQLWKHTRLQTSFPINMLA